MKKISIAQPFFDHLEEQAVIEVLRSGWIVQGPKVNELENEFAHIIGSRYAVACSSGTAALHLMLKALNIGPGDQIIVPAFSWVSTANVVRHCGAEVVFCDVDPESYNLDPKLLDPLINERTKAIIAVHLFGLCADIDAIELCVPNIPIIEDAACAFGAQYRGRSSGTLGKMGAFSLHPRKAITSGEGGVVVLDDEAHYQKIKILINHGINPWEKENQAILQDLPAVTEAGFNYRMTDLQAAIALVQLKKWDQIYASRVKGAKLYCEGLAQHAWLDLPNFDSTIFKHGWQSYVVCLNEKAKISAWELISFLREKNIEARPGTYAIPETLFYQRTQKNKCSTPVARFLQRATVALPLHPLLSENDYQMVIDAFNSISS